MTGNLLTVRASGLRARRLGLFAAVVVVVVGAAFAVLVISQSPAPLPSGATRLELATQPGPVVPVLGCAAALVPPVRVVQVGSTVQFVVAETGRLRTLVWPPGYSAWLRDGRTEIVNHDGVVVARDGDVITNLGAIGGNLCLSFDWSPELER